jgi:hypothetical protein
MSTDCLIGCSELASYDPGRAVLVHTAAASFQKFFSPRSRWSAGPVLYRPGAARYVSTSGAANMWPLRFLRDILLLLACVWSADPVRGSLLASRARVKEGRDGIVRVHIMEGQ